MSPPGNAAERALNPSLLDGCRVLSLDVFDTAIGRVVARPVDVFEFVGRSYVARHHASPFDFAGERAAAERASRRDAVAAGKSEEVTLDAIYDALRLPADWRRDELLALELHCERMLTVVNPDVHALYREARRRAIPVVFVSDTYLGREHLSRLLAHHGYEGDRVFPSCEHGSNKGGGGLWRVVIDELDIAPSAILHIGDNPVADVAQARAAGIVAHAYDATPLVDAGGPYASLALSLARRRRLELRDDFWSRLGYEIAGPLYLGFVRWLIERINEDGIEQVFFCARDGYIWQQVYELVRRSGVAAPRSEYLYASRRAFFIPGLTRVDEEALDYLCIGRAPLRVADYLSRCGLAVDAAAIAAVGFASADARVKSADDRRRLRSLFQRLTPELLSRAASERETLLAYLGRLGLIDIERAAIVDIGWHGSIQLGLARALAAAGKARPLWGYYVGTFAGASRLRSVGPAARGWLCDEGDPSHYEQLIRCCIEVFEFLHLAPHASVVTFELAGGEARPVFGPDDADDVKHKAATSVQQAALAFVEDFLKRSAPFPWLAATREEAIAPLRRLMEQPTLAEAAHMGELAHADGFGPAFNATPIARPSVEPTLKKLPALYRDYHAAFWKEGYVVRMLGDSPRVQGALRMLRFTRALSSPFRDGRFKLRRIVPRRVYFDAKDELYNLLAQRAPGTLALMRRTFSGWLRRLEDRLR